jgi:6-phosphofructokinase 1
VVIAEGDGKIVFELKDYIEEHLPEYVRVSVLGHMQRWIAFVTTESASRD